MLKNETLMDIYQLKDVIRYNCRKHIKDESVAEHSFYVALMSLMICEEKHIKDERIIRDAVTKSLLHDMPEIDLNDITHNVKEALNLRPMLKKYEDEYFEHKFPEYAKLMADDSENVVNTIVLLADSMSVKQFCMNEINLGNNDPEIKKIYESSVKRCEKHEHNLDAVLHKTINKYHHFD